MIFTSFYNIFIIFCYLLTTILCNKTTPHSKTGVTKTKKMQKSTMIHKIKTIATTSKKTKATNIFGFEDYSSVTLASYFDDPPNITRLTDNMHFNYTTLFANNREMYRARKWMRYMNREEARLVDKELYNRFGYTMDQIAELSGRTVAHAIERHYKPENYSDVLCVCGSGNNGLYGMVTARHLKLMGYDPTIFLINDYNQSRTEGYRLFTQLKKQCQGFNIPIIRNLPSNISVIKSIHKLYVDAVFGINYERHKFDRYPKNNRYSYSLKVLQDINKDKRYPIVSIDIPSGWDPNIGNYEGHHINPQMLVSLICPKLGVIEFFGTYHYIGGNFIPEILNEKYQLFVPKYNGSDPLIPLETMAAYDTTETNEMFTMWGSGPAM